MHNNARYIKDGRLSGVTDYGAFLAEDELEVDRLFAAVSSQFEQAYNNDYTSKAIAAVESRRRGTLTRK